MYSVTWIVCNRLKSITTPSWETAWDVYAGLKNNGEQVRMWNPDKSLFDIDFMY